MTLEDILDNYNADGKIYRCDVKNLFGWDLSTERIDEIVAALEELRKMRALQDQSGMI